MSLQRASVPHSDQGGVVTPSDDSDVRSNKSFHPNVCTVCAIMEILHSYSIR
jgi:hypothetical protein